MIAMARYAYPHTIDNGAGERITFLRRIARPAGDRIEGENLTQPGAGPPMHVHYLQEEAFTVHEGRLGYQVEGGPERFAGPGETVVFAPGQAHRFWNAGTGELATSSWVEPADNAEYLLTELFASTRRHGGRGPDPFDAAFLMTRYRREFGLRNVPAAVQRVVFPLLVAIGTVLGRYARYADAPAPVRRKVRGAGGRPLEVDPGAQAAHRH